MSYIVACIFDRRETRKLPRVVRKAESAQCRPKAQGGGESFARFIRRTVSTRSAPFDGRWNRSRNGTTDTYPCITLGSVRVPHRRNKHENVLPEGGHPLLRRDSRAPKLFQASFFRFSFPRISVSLSHVARVVKRRHVDFTS